MTKAAALIAGGVTALAMTGLAVLVPSASAAVHTVRLTDNGPVPASLTLRPGDQVEFVNGDSIPHEVTSEGSWQYDSGPLPPGQTSSATPALTAPGTYRYADDRGIVVLPQTFHGSLVVPVRRPYPTPTHASSPSPAHSARPAPRRTSVPAVSPTPHPSASAAPRPTPTPSRSPSPPAAPPAASPPPAPVPTSLPTNLLYGEPRSLVQHSPHRYGLPALLAGVVIGGAVSLLGRYLLSLPEGRRTGS